MCVLIEHEGKRPRVAGSAYVAPTAVLCGDVTIGEDSRVLFGAVLTAEGGDRDRVELHRHGERARAGPSGASRAGGRPCSRRPPRARQRGRGGARRVSGHRRLNLPGGARGAGSEVRINAVVQVNSSVAERSTVPIGWIAVGDPAQLFPPQAHEELWPVQRAMDFPGTVFGIERDQLTMEKVARGYVEHFGRHQDDRVIE